MYIYIYTYIRWVTVHGPKQQPKPLFLTYLECVQIAHKVYGGGHHDLGREFLLSVGSSKKLFRGDMKGGVDTRRIEVHDLLYLSVSGYHKSQSQFLGEGLPMSDISEIDEDEKVVRLKTSPMVPVGEKYKLVTGRTDTNARNREINRMNRKMDVDNALNGSISRDRNSVFNTLYDQDKEFSPSKGKTYSEK
jgi:hypothetical protein